MKKTIKTVALVTLITVNGQWPTVSGQEVWNVDQCMSYAVAHNHQVHQKELEVKNNQMDKLSAIGSFMPSVDGGVSARYSFGRGIDPETNVYDNISTFHNNYFIEASMPIFQGGSLVNQVRKAQANLKMGKAALQEAQDNTALDAFQAYIQALYCMGTVRMAKQKLAESDSLLYKARLQEELGMKGMADVAQMEAQQATDAYNYTHQQHLYETAMLTLKQKMNYPMEEALLLDSTLLDSPVMEQANLELIDKEQIVNLALAVNPTLQKSMLNAQAQKMQSKVAWSEVLPSVSLYAGLSTSYYKQLHVSSYPSFRNQFKDNYGSYIGVSLSVPIFNQLKGVSGIRKARNSYRIAQEQYEEQKLELRKLVEQAVMDREGYLKESIQMEKKAASDKLAYQVTKRKYEEGLMTSLDVQNNAATWLESQAGLLQSKLTYYLKCRLVEYYKGTPLIP
ncbi:MAG: TolC family protein [Bacteroidaceae bacterium]|nr:TolC family protein [Bacteroidaceae bacterium]